MNSLNTIRQFGFAHLAKEAPRIHHDGQNLKITMLVSMICDIAINQLSYFNHHRKESPSLSPAKLTRQWHYDVVKSINAARYAATQLKARLAEKSLELTTYNPFKFIANLLRKVAYKKLISELCRAIEAFDRHSKPENPPMD